jgi:hypothetical protein
MGARTPMAETQQGCTCPHEWKSLGTLYGLSMGKGWVRMLTAEDCPAHKDEPDEGDAA